MRYGGGQVWLCGFVGFFLEKIKSHTQKSHTKSHKSHTFIAVFCGFVAFSAKKPQSHSEMPHKKPQKPHLKATFKAVAFCVAFVAFLVAFCVAFVAFSVAFCESVALWLFLVKC